MLLPIIHGYIDRRILVNFTADPEVVRKIIPPPFRPKVYNGRSILGICLIRLKHIKPKGWPDFMGISSENGAHRIAVEWEEEGQLREGVYIPRRDTSLRLNALVGGRLFPGKHHLGHFKVNEKDGNYEIDIRSSDNTEITLHAAECAAFDPHSIFETLENASSFFEQGSLGYSPNGQRFDGLRLETFHWQVRPLSVRKAGSSFFENEALFPKGSIRFDNALLMTRVEHYWKSVREPAPSSISKVI